MIRLGFIVFASMIYGLLFYSGALEVFQISLDSRIAMLVAFIRHVLLVTGFGPLLFFIASCLFAKGSHMYIRVLLLFVMLFFLHVVVFAFSAHTDDMYWVMQGVEVLVVSGCLYWLSHASAAYKLKR